MEAGKRLTVDGKITAHQLTIKAANDIFLGELNVEQLVLDFTHLSDQEPPINLYIVNDSNLAVTIKGHIGDISITTLDGDITLAN